MSLLERARAAVGRFLPGACGRLYLSTCLALSAAHQLQVFWYLLLTAVPDGRGTPDARDFPIGAKGESVRSQLRMPYSASRSASSVSSRAMMKIPKRLGDVQGGGRCPGRAGDWGNGDEDVLDLLDRDAGVRCGRCVLGRRPRAYRRPTRAAIRAARSELVSSFAPSERLRGHGGGRVLDRRLGAMRR